MSFIKTLRKTGFVMRMAAPEEDDGEGGEGNDDVAELFRDGGGIGPSLAEDAAVYEVQGGFDGLADDIGDNERAPIELGKADDQVGDRGDRGGKTRHKDRDNGMLGDAAFEPGDERRLHYFIPTETLDDLAAIAARQGKTNQVANDVSRCRHNRDGSRVHIALSGKNERGDNDRARRNGHGDRRHKDDQKKRRIFIQQDEGKQGGEY